MALTLHAPTGKDERALPVGNTAIITDLAGAIRTYREKRVLVGDSADHSGHSRASNLPPTRKRSRVGALFSWLRVTAIRLFLPDGYPDSVAPGYLHFMLLSHCAVCANKSRTV